VIIRICLSTAGLPGSFVLAASFSPAAYYLSSIHSKGSTIATYEDYNSTPNWNIILKNGFDQGFQLASATEFMQNLNVGLSLNIYSGERIYQAMKPTMTPKTI
jgi:hypothetical protein